MKVIHLGNMAGDSYNNVKFLREKGIEADLVIDPRSHVTEHPEWYEGEFDGQVDEWAPNWDAVHVEGYVPPSWLRYEKLGVAFRPRGLISTLRRFNMLVRDYDIIQAAVLEPINCCLSGIKPYIAYSKGSDLRDVPFEKTLRGKLMTQALKQASRIFITNPDTLSSAKTLGLTDAIYMPFIVDGNVYKPASSSLRQTLQQEYDFDFLIANPSRQDWLDKGNDKLVRAFARLVKEEHASVLLAMVEWGIDLDRSKQLVRELGLGERVTWFPIMNKRKLVTFYNASDIVFDHVNLQSYGTTPLEAMACGKPVIAKLPNREIAEFCWADDSPPLMDVQSEEEILKTLRNFYSDKPLRERVGSNSRNWVIRHHNWQLVVEKHIEAYSSMLS
jgi:glycosyltransferase involved in cell wall biosynthesis